MSNRKISETTKNLIAAREVIKKPENWTISQLARSRAGAGMSHDLQNAYSFCARGALLKVKGVMNADDNFYWVYSIIEEDMMLFRAINNVSQVKLDDLSGPYNPGGYNNSHSHENVLAMFDKAIALSIMEDQKADA